MARYAAFLRGVMPTNLSMAALVRALEQAGFTEVRTVLASGNAVFTAPACELKALEAQVEAAIERAVGRRFEVTLRSLEALRALCDSDPFAGVALAREAKRVVSFARGVLEVPAKLPIERDGAQIVAVRGAEVFTAYVPSPKGPVFMELIEKTFGREITTRTWNTLLNVLKAGEVADAVKPTTKRAVKAATAKAVKTKRAVKGR